MSETKIRIRDNGPFLVEGPVTLEDSEGNSYTIDKPSIALCRCGHSDNKPFCDGKHKHCGFTSEDRANPA
ncbi:Iron-binding zinc finger CDGSH type [Bremerella volcania]|uniref:Iron-binding zinc finger CDGSH type n=1 Tax=Bremerella volcania TaxID=2527984 RepID=A0A518CFV3_9BACT|nr:CDGSH iron-sulfur domain-containing protein [Bremerella volcania]QDU78106.1 Iron-binding zinc finger CDGSH type [Bremerella volcania]